MDLYTLYYLCLLESSFLWLFHIGHQMHLCLNQAWTMVHAWFRLETQSTNTVCVCVCVSLHNTAVCACVQCGCADEMTEMWQDETFWSLNTISHSKIRFLGNQLCKYGIMQIVHLNKSVGLRGKAFWCGFVLWVRLEGGQKQRASKRKNERRQRQTETESVKMRIRLKKVTGRQFAQLHSWFGFLIRENQRNRQIEENKS